jgi:hypothetical protein
MQMWEEAGYEEWRNIPEDAIRHSHRRENLRSYRNRLVRQTIELELELELESELELAADVNSVKGHRRIHLFK